MSHSTVFSLFVVVVLLSLFIGAIALPATPSDDQDLEWATLIKCNNFLNEFKKSIADHQACYSKEMIGVRARSEEYWTKVPGAVDECNVIAPLGSFKVETITKDDRGPLWYIRPTKGHPDTDGSLSMVSVGLDRGDEAAERELRTSIPRVHHHRGEGVALVLTLADRYNFSSTGRFYHVGTRRGFGGSIRISCFDIEENQSSSERSFLEHPSPDTPPTDLLWIAGGISSTSEESHGLVRGYLIFDGKQTDITNICQISVRNLWSKPRMANFTHEARWIPHLSPVPSEKVICQTQMSWALRVWWMDRPFVPIRSGYYRTADNDTYFNEFFVNIENPKCVSKFLANRPDIGRCEPQSIEKGRVEKGRFEVESEVSRIEG